MDLVKQNQDMLKNKLYNVKDTKDLGKVAQLKPDKINDYDLYVIACCLCNYNIPNIDEMLDKRLELFLKINASTEDYSHIETDYDDTIKYTTDINCINTKSINKYGFYEYIITANNSDLVGKLWGYKDIALKYVDSKTFPDKVVISTRKDLFDGFIQMLDELCVNYDIDDLKSLVFYENTSNIPLIDINKLDLPFDLYDYQIEDATNILKKKRMLIGSEMGTGKTLVSILVGESIDTPKLVICPESLRLNWKKEILMANNNADVDILLSNETPHFGKDWTIVGYKTADKFLANLKGFQCIFIDEVHNCKAVNNWGKPTSKRAKAILDIANEAEYCYLLSGTPMPSHNKDLFNILKMLKCEEFDFNNQWAFKNYADKFCDPKDTYWGKDYSGNSNSTELHKILSNLMVRRLKKDVLPNLKKQRQFIPIEPKFKKDYKDIEDRLYYPIGNDTYMGLAMTGRAILSQYKVDTAIELAESLINADESVVLVTNFNETADKLKDHFKDDCVEIRGGMSDIDKDISIEAFQKKISKICILNMEAGGVGITLTAAHTMIIIDYAWLPASMSQVEDRICRTGQTEPCLIYYIYCENSILDGIFINMITDKSSNIDLVVDDVENTFNLSKDKLENSTYIEQLKATIKNTKNTKKAKKPSKKTK